MDEVLSNLKIAGISERDTDLLLLEEFLSSTDFCSFVLATIGLDGMRYRLVEGARSVTDSTGESDLEILFEESSGTRLLCLFENKVNAGFQPKQAERYRERGNKYLHQGRCHNFVTVLLAPDAYFSNDSKGFDVRLNYEQIREWFERSDLPAGRKRYKMTILTSAIEKSSSGYVLVADSAATEFWRDYWRLCMDIAPELGMVEPDNKPAGASFIYFYDAELPDGIDLVHKLPHGHFDLQFAGMGNKLQDMRARYGHKIDNDMKIVPAAKSASIRIIVPKLSISIPLSEQKDAALIALTAGQKLTRWAKGNIEL